MYNFEESKRFFEAHSRIIGEVPECADGHSLPRDHVWVPPGLNEPQLKVFFDNHSEAILADGEKGSGKSIGSLHKVVNTTYHLPNARGLIVTPTALAGESGVIYDMMTLVIPSWEKGDYKLDGEGFKKKPKTHHDYFALYNKFGGRSEILFMSVPNDGGLEGKIKGPAPDIVYIEELTDYKSSHLFNLASAQLGRKKGRVQQLVATCNPKGPSNWVYDLFINPETAREGYARYYHPFSSNAHNMPADYQSRLEKIYRNDPISLARLRAGEWIDSPDGDALFLDYFIPEMHILGGESVGSGILPTPGSDIVLGYDLGQVNSSVTFLQRLPTVRKIEVADAKGNPRFEDLFTHVWTIFDEVVVEGKKVSYSDLTRQVLKKMDLWCEFIGHSFNFLHIADDSATNQYRPNTGAHDADDIMKFSNGRIRMRPAPKGKNSRKARVRSVCELLKDESLFVSKQCPKAIEMFNGLPDDPDEPGTPKKKHRFGHRFDSMSYPIFYFDREQYMRNRIQTGPRPVVKHYEYT